MYLCTSITRMLIIRATELQVDTVAIQATTITSLNDCMTACLGDSTCLSIDSDGINCCLCTSYGDLDDGTTVVSTYYDVYSKSQSSLGSLFGLLSLS